jgi:hypothetical protein
MHAETVAFEPIIHLQHSLVSLPGFRGDKQIACLLVHLGVGSNYMHRCLIIQSGLNTAISISHEAVVELLTFSKAALNESMNTDVFNALSLRLYLETVFVLSQCTRVGSVVNAENHRDFTELS